MCGAGGAPHITVLWEEESYEEKATESIVEIDPNEIHVLTE